MAYMILILQPPHGAEAISDAEGKRRYDVMMAYAADLGRTGKLLAGDALGTDETGTRISRAGGKRVAVDGPFSEAKEVVGGFFLLDCATRGEAMALAERCPAADWTIVELRETGPCWPVEQEAEARTG